MDFKICKDRLHIFPFPEGCPANEHDDCDESFTESLRNQDTAEGLLTHMPRCQFCFPV